MKSRVLLAVLLFAASVAYADILDNFNRPDSPTLGPNWTVQNGGAEIYSLTARASGASQSFNLVTYNGVSSNNAFVDVYSMDSSLAYIALDIAYLDVSNNYFIKVQNQGGGASGFNYAAFYYGNNGPTGDFFLLNSPFTSGQITASFLGTIATLSIDSNFDGIADQTYTFDYGISTGGTGIGLGLYGTAQADNFGTSAVPEPGSMLLLGTGLLGVAGAIRRKLSL